MRCCVFQWLVLTRQLPYPLRDGTAGRHEQVLDVGIGDAAARRGWEIRGVVKGPRQADPVIHGATWTAWAAGDGQRVEGHGDTAEEAMADLANQLRAIRPDPNG